MVPFMKKVLIFLLIVVVLSFLFTDNNQIESSTSISEVIDIIDKDNVIKDDEIEIKEDVVTQSKSNIFVDLIYFVSSIIIKIFDFPLIQSYRSSEVGYSSRLL